MRIVFMGTPEFAVEVLRRVVEDGWNVVAAYTQPDKPKNRGMKLVPTPVKEYALSVSIPVYQPQSCRDEATLEQLRARQSGIRCRAVRSPSRQILSLPPKKPPRLP